jgi:hypothetical protein
MNYLQVVQVIVRPPHRSVFGQRQHTTGVNAINAALIQFLKFVRDAQNIAMKIFFCAG